MLAGDAHPVSADLPRAPNTRIDQGIGTATIGRALGDSDKLLGLGRQKRQRDDTDAVDLQPRRRDFGRAGREKITGLSNRAQYICKS